MIIKQLFIVFFLVLLLILVITQYSLIRYGFRQASGQINILFNTKPVEEVLGDPEFPDSLKTRIRLIREVKNYAIDSLGLKGSKNYTTFYNQQGKELMWVVTACKPFKLEAYTWDFPVIGSFTYKGFFDQEMAVEEESKLKEEGYDTDIRNASGWSTLGLFRDPILSGMLFRSKGRLAELILHELTHGTIFVRDSIELNENVATFIGQQGALRFLSSHYGAESVELSEYQKYIEDKNRFTNYVLKGAAQLDSLYNTYEDFWSREKKMDLKRQWLRRFRENIDTVSFNINHYYHNYFEGFYPNNTFFMSYFRYRGGQGFFLDELTGEYNSDLRQYISILKEKYND